MNEIFGQQNGQGTGNIPEVNPQGVTSQSPGNLPPQQNIQTQAPAFKIDPRFSTLPPEEGISRTHQSIVTPLFQKINELEAENSKFNTYVENLSAIMEPTNAELRRAFIYELEPSLVPQIDIDEEVQSMLDKKYGVGFEPDPSETNWNSPSEKYKRDVSRFTSEVEKKLSDKTSSRTFAEMKADIKAKKQAAQDADRKAINDLRTKYNMPDAEFNAFMNYSKKLSVEDLYMKYKNDTNYQKTSHVSSAMGNPVTGNELKAKIDNLFG